MNSTMSYLKSNKSEIVEKEFGCDFCKKSFMTERSLIVHMCEAGRRFRARNDVIEKQAYQCYARFYQRRMYKKKIPNEAQFEKSTYYLAFVRFSKYIRDIRAINPLGFIDFLITREIALDDWEKPSIYERYVKEWNKTETPSQALERSFLLFEGWAKETGHHWTDYFNKVSAENAILLIISGRLSPWIIFTASSAKNLLDRFNGEQMDMFNKSIDVNFWKHKIKLNQNEVDEIRSIMSEINL